MEEIAKNQKINAKEQKRLASYTAIDYLIEENRIFSGMKIGLGTGSTAFFAIERLASKISDGMLKNICAVVTSFQTEDFCRNFGIRVYNLNDLEIAGHLDLTIDGADEIDEKNNLTKGGGAALLREKIAAYNSDFYAIVADSSKAVKNLGVNFPLPVEIFPFAKKSVQNALESLGAKSVLREGQKKCGPVITDNANMILDCLWNLQNPPDPEQMEFQIKKIPGVVEVGFFTQNPPIVFLADENSKIQIRGAKNEKSPKIEKK